MIFTPVRIIKSGLYCHMHFFRIALVCVLVAGCSSKKEEPVNTYKNEKFGFSIVPPNGWTMVTADGAPDFLRQHGDRLTRTSQDAMLNPVVGRNTWVVAWVKLDAKDKIAPMLWVTHNSVGLPSVGPPELEKSKAALRAKVAATGWRDFTQESAQLGETDGLKDVWMQYAGTLDGAYLRVSETMVPSRNMTHFVALSAEIPNWEEYSRLYGEVVFRFRSFGQR